MLVVETMARIRRGHLGILDALSDAVDMHEGHVGRAGQWRANDVKEKFGTLRISSSGGDAHTSALEHFALLMSARTCQRCGAPRELRRFGDEGFPQWHATLCDECCAAEVAGRYGISSEGRH